MADKIQSSENDQQELFSSLCIFLIHLSIYVLIIFKKKKVCQDHTFKAKK